MTPLPPALRHGVDVVDVARLRAVMESTPDFEADTFTAGERAYCRRRADPWPHFAARFAAKEAVLKALGIGLSDDGADRAFEEIEVVREEGPPRLVFHGAIARLAARAGCLFPTLSLAHDGPVAIASVVWLDGGGDGRR